MATHLNALAVLPVNEECFDASQFYWIVGHGDGLHVAAWTSIAVETASNAKVRYDVERESSKKEQFVRKEGTQCRSAFHSV